MKEANSLAVKRVDTNNLAAPEVDEIKALMLAAFAEDEHGGFTEADWQHAIGGVHFLLTVGGRIATHASVVERWLHVAATPLRTGYVEAVATAPDLQRRGFGSAVMRQVNDYIRDIFEIGALGTGSQAFYERLGWQPWRGPTLVRTPGGDQPTPEEDGYILVLTTPASPPVDFNAPISCEWREGDVW